MVSDVLLAYISYPMSLEPIRSDRHARVIVVGLGYGSFNVHVVPASRLGRGELLVGSLGDFIFDRSYFPTLLC